MEPLGNRVLLWRAEDKTLPNATVELRLAQARRLRTLLDQAVRQRSGRST